MRNMVYCQVVRKKVIKGQLDWMEALIVGG